MNRVRKWAGVVSRVMLTLLALAAGCSDDELNGNKSDCRSRAQACASGFECVKVGSRWSCEPSGGGAGGANGAAGAGGAEGGNGGAADEETTSKTIGPSGGEITLSDGASLVIPEGALDESTTITLARTGKPVPDGYEGYSSVYRLEPAGLEFPSPVTIEIPFDGNANLAALFHTRASAIGFARVGGVASGGVLRAEIDHFSEVFVANGVDYDAPSNHADPACGGRVEVLKSRAMRPAMVAGIVRVEDCNGVPARGLSAADFAPSEDESPLSVEAIGFSVLPHTTAIQAFITLALDFSSSTDAVRDEVVAGAHAFVDTIEDRGVPVQLALVTFAGEEGVTTHVAHTLDLAEVRSGIESLLDFTHDDPGSTNLNGGIAEAWGATVGAANAFEQRNGGGAFGVPFVVLFTDGRDTAGYAEPPSLPGELVAVALPSADFDAGALTAIAGGPGYEENVLLSIVPADLGRDFAALAGRLGAIVDGAIYRIGYCTPKRSGSHDTAFAVANVPTDTEAFSFDATGFTSGCSGSILATLCDGQECGGFGCGACDDRIAACNVAARVCVDHCTTAGVCDDSDITNVRGYAQTCLEEPPEKSSCAAGCVDTTSEPADCGRCNSACGPGEACLGADCVAPAVVADLDQDFLDINDVLATIDGNLFVFGAQFPALRLTRIAPDGTSSIVLGNGDFDALGPPSADDSPITSNWRLIANSSDALFVIFRLARTAGSEDQALVRLPLAGGSARVITRGACTSGNCQAPIRHVSVVDEDLYFHSEDDSVWKVAGSASPPVAWTGVVPSDGWENSYVFVRDDVFRFDDGARRYWVAGAEIRSIATESVESTPWDDATVLATLSSGALAIVDCGADVCVLQEAGVVSRVHKLSGEMRQETATLDGVPLDLVAQGASAEHVLASPSTASFIVLPYSRMLPQWLVEVRTRPTVHVVRVMLGREGTNTYPDNSLDGSKMSVANGSLFLTIIASPSAVMTNLQQYVRIDGLSTN